MDTSSLIALKEHYPRKTFSPIWDKLLSLMIDGIILSVSEVGDEIDARDEELMEWIKGCQYFFYPLDEEIQQEVRNILLKYPCIIDIREKKSGADPFVIALAKLTNCTVVSEEKKLNSPLPKKIPDVCSALSLTCIKLSKLFEELKFRIDLIE